MEHTGGADGAGGADCADRTWETVGRLHSWLHENSRYPPEQEVLLRVLKLSEEVGEVAQAVIGAKGQNPRKGTSHSCYL
ncbi:MazG-like family protein [Streptomyces sp. NPDC003023]|uniref:MazG-like family protein n=1 Tax=Streptomyces sp. NPDC003023 TaxID=3364675 RepID=UPI0036AEC904